MKKTTPSIKKKIFEFDRHATYYIENGNSIFFDVDDTLIIHSDILSLELQERVTIKDPYLDLEFTYTPHLSHINLLKRNYNRGKIIVVWSAGGALWAKSVIEALDLVEYVHLIMEKPTVYCDDMPIDTWNPKRIYIRNNGGR